jgi:phenylacetic acid degradation operon negative regulatory protein
VDRFVKAAEQVLGGFRQRRPMRAGSLIVSFFGDVVAPRGGSVWLGGLIQILEQMGVSGRLVRTSMYRLVQDGWFEASKSGRKSYYSLTPVGGRRFRLATERIYGRPRDDWQGEWLMVLVPPGKGDQRDSLRKELGWMGFGSLSTGLMGRPVGAAPELEEFLAEQSPPPIAYRARLLDSTSPELLEEMIRNSWKLGETEQGYQRFIKCFAPLLDAASNSANLPGEVSLLLRVLLVHEYRRILLRDPQLPAALLPQNWHGQLAYELCRDLYGALLGASEEYVSAALVTQSGPLPPPGSGFFSRFGGLNPA